MEDIIVSTERLRNPFAKARVENISFVDFPASTKLHYLYFFRYDSEA